MATMSETMRKGRNDRRRRRKQGQRRTQVSTKQTRAENRAAERRSVGALLAMYFGERRNEGGQRAKRAWKVRRQHGRGRR